MTTDITEQRPRSSSEVMDASLIMYRQNFWHLIAIAALYQIPLTIVSLAVIRTFFDGVAPDLYSTLQPAGAWDTTHLIGWVGLGLLSTAALSFGLAAMIWSVGSRLQGERPGLVAAYHGALPRVPAYLLTHILVSALFAGLVSLQWPVG